MESLRRTDKEKHARALQDSQQRERQISSVNNDLTRALSHTERRAEELVERVQALERKAELGSVGSDNHYRNPKEQQDMLKQMSATAHELDVEKDRVQRVEREMRALKHELALAHTTAHTIARRVDLTRTENEEKIGSLTTELNRCKGIEHLNTQDSGKEELRKQLNVLTERVLTQQATIETVTSQRVLLQQKNVELKEINLNLTRVSKSYTGGRGGRDGGDGEEEDDFDLEEGSGISGSGNARLQRRRGPRSSHPSNDMIPDTPGRRRRVSGMTSIKQLRPLLDKNQTIANVVSGIDRFAFLAMNVIRRFPMARLLFLTYMLTLHVWSIFLVSHHQNHCGGGSMEGVRGVGVGRHIPGAMPRIPGPPIHH